MPGEPAVGVRFEFKAPRVTHVGRDTVAQDG